MSFVVEQKIKGRIYLYRVEAYWDKHSKKAKQKRTYIGPKDKVQKSDIKTVISHLTTKNHGNILFFESILQSLGLDKILQSCFEEEYREIIALAYYEIMEASPGYLFHYWLEEQDLKGVKSLYSSDISKLHESIGRNQMAMNLFTRKWIESLHPIRGIYYDITSFSSYSTKNEFVEWGYNRDKETLPQINMGMVCCRERGLPFFYRIHQGSIVDVSTINNFLEYLKVYQLKDLMLIMDRGFFSTSNILGLLDSPGNIKFLQPLSFSLKKTKELIKQNVRALKNANTAFKYNGEVFHHVTAPVPFDNRVLSAHVFFNERAELDQKLHFLSQLLDIESKFKEQKFETATDAKSFIQSEISEKSRVFFKWDKTSKSIIKNNTEINARIAQLGYFIIATNEQDIDKATVLDCYRDKDRVEKIFDVVKNEMDGDRLRSHSRYNTDGRLFIKYIALIIYMQITKIMRDKKLFEKFSIQELLRELSKMKITYIDNFDPIKSDISKKQNDILKAFDIKT
jgi:transposase